MFSTGQYRQGGRGGLSVVYTPVPYYKYMYIDLCLPLLFQSLQLGDIIASEQHKLYEVNLFFCASAFSEKDDVTTSDLRAAFFAGFS